MIILQAIIMVASTAYQMKQQKKAKQRAEAAADKRKGFQFTVSGEASHLPIVYGKNVLGGIEVRHNVTNGYTAATDVSDKLFTEGMSNSSSGGSKNEFLHVQYALCTEGIEGVQWVKVDGQHYNDSSKKFQHVIRTFNEGGTADPIATSNGISATNTFTDTAYASATYKLDRDENNYGGAPTMEFLVKGRKVKHVEKTGSVYTLSSTEAYSNNPALVLLDYLTHPHGRGMDVANIDLKSFYKSANVCDTVVSTTRTIGGKVNGQHTVHTVATLGDRPTDLEERTYENELWYVTANSTYYQWHRNTWKTTNFNSKRVIPLYECNLTLSTAETIRDNIEAIMQTMGLAELTWSSEGKYKLLLEHPTSLSELEALVDSAHTFTDDDIIRDAVDINWPAAVDRLSQATVSFMNEHEDFKDDTVTWPKSYSLAHNTYLTEDNDQPFTADITVGGITDPYHALAMAEQAVRKSRSLYNVTITVSKKGLNLEPGDFVIIDSETIGIEGDVFRIESISINGDFTVKLTLYHFDHEVLAWNVNDDVAYSSPPVFDFSIDAPTLPVFSATSLALGTASGNLSWTAADDINVDEYIVELKLSSGGDWLSAGTTRNNSVDIAGLATGTYDFSVRSRSYTGAYSSRLLLENESITLETVGKVLVVYADTNNASTNTQSLTLGTNTSVAYYTYVSDEPTLPIRTDINFASFVGADGLNGADGTNGTNGTDGDDGADGSNNIMVFAYKWGTAISTNSPATNRTYRFDTKDWGSIDGGNGWTLGEVPTKGSNTVLSVCTAIASSATDNATVTASDWSTVVVASEDGATGDTGGDGDDGAPGPRFAQRAVYTTTQLTSTPSAPSATITWSSGNIIISTSGWSETPPTQTAANAGSVYQSNLVFADLTGSASTSTDTGSTPVAGVSFTGLVSFNSTNGSFLEGGTTVTNIDGGNIASGSIIADVQIEVGTAGISGTTLSGQGAVLNQGGDFFVGNSASFGSRLFYDNSEATLDFVGTMQSNNFSEGFVTGVDISLTSYQTNPTNTRNNNSAWSFGAAPAYSTTADRPTTWAGWAGGQLSLSTTNKGKFKAGDRVTIKRTSGHEGTFEVAGIGQDRSGGFTYSYHLQLGALISSSGNPTGTMTSVTLTVLELDVNLLTGWRLTDAGSSTISSVTTESLNGRRYGASSDGLTIGNETTGILGSPTSIVIGDGAAADITASAQRNVIIGHRTAENMTTSDDCVIIGAVGFGPDNVLTGHDNTIIGAIGDLSLSTGNGNSVLGKDAGENLTTGKQNTIMGGFAGQLIQTGQNNIVLGYTANASSNSVSNEITLGNTSITSLRCNDTSISGLSDSRDKTDITELSLGLSTVNSIAPKKYKRNNRGFYWDEGVFDSVSYAAETQKLERFEFGFIAQEVEAVVPCTDDRLISIETNENGDEQYRFRMAEMTPIVWNAVRELDAKHEALQAKVDAAKAVAASATTLEDIKAAFALL